MNYLPYYLSHIGPDHLLLIIYFYFFLINVDDWLLMKMIRLIIILEDLFKPSACKHSHPPFSNQILTHQKFYFDIFYLPENSWKFILAELTSKNNNMCLYIEAMILHEMPINSNMMKSCLQVQGSSSKKPSPPSVLILFLQGFIQ